MIANANDSGLPTSPERGIKVNDVSEEYAFVQQALCSCGAQGKFEVRRQALVKGPRGMMDRIDVRCTACDASFSFYFDVSELPYFS
jgi:hypothetical protein